MFYPESLQTHRTPLSHTYMPVTRKQVVLYMLWNKPAAWRRWYAHFQCRQNSFEGTASFSSCHRCKLVL